MEINDFKARKLKMDNEICSAIEKAMNDFREDTGYSPESINVHLIEITKTGDDKKHYVVAEVLSSVEI